MEPTTPYTVTEVRVMAENVDNLGFAGHLQDRLEASVGRATADVGQTSSLRIVVQDRRRERSPVNLFGGTSETVSLDLSLLDSASGQLLRRQSLNTTVSDFNGEQNADMMLVARLTDDIRRLLGLSGYTPYPVSGLKRDVVRPSSNPGRFDVDDEALRSADPLLNGTVTPTTVNLIVESDKDPEMDFSRPLLDAKPPQRPSDPVVPAVASTPLRVQQSADVEAPELPTVSQASEAGSSDEPCIITLENDCSDPDSR